MRSNLSTERGPFLGGRKESSFSAVGEGDHVSREADALRQQATDDIARFECRAAAERSVREALEKRGLIARLLNRKPTMVEG